MEFTHTEFYILTKKEQICRKVLKHILVKITPNIRFFLLWLHTYWGIKLANLTLYGVHNASLSSLNLR